MKYNHRDEDKEEIANHLFQGLGSLVWLTGEVMEDCSEEGRSLLVARIMGDLESSINTARRMQSSIVAQDYVCTGELLKVTAENMFTFLGYLQLMKPESFCGFDVVAEDIMRGIGAVNDIDRDFNVICGPYDMLSMDFGPVQEAREDLNRCIESYNRSLTERRQSVMKK